MAVLNTAPIAPGKPAYQWGNSALVTANTAIDGSGSIHEAFVATAQGGPVRNLNCHPLGTNTATVIRAWRYDAVRATWHLLREITAAATTVSQVAGIPTYVIPLNVVLMPNDKIGVTIGTTVAAGFHCSVDGGDFTVSA